MTQTFKSIKLYTNQRVNIEELFEKLINYGYKRCQRPSEEGDFAQHGEIIEIFPIGFQEPIRIELLHDTAEKISSFDILTGKSLVNHNMVILLPIAGLRTKKIRRKPTDLGGEYPIDNFIDIEPGDYVVHTNSGIGRYRGLEKLKIGKTYEDHLLIEYAEGDKLYVPINDLHLIQKYVAFHKRPPKLYKLGSKMWQKIKNRVKKGIYTLAYELLEMQAKRSLLKGFGFSKDCDWQKDLEKAFPFQETPDQLKSTLELKKDMEETTPMDRLLCGDVGYGKTEVALRAAFKAVMDNKQVAVLVPTTILAEQHFNTFSSRMKDYPVNIQMLSRFRTKKEQEKAVEDLKNGKVDIVIGTHRLLSPDVRFKDLGLLIIDEEQRFGVKHKEKLKKMRLLVDILTLTATPIPRTLYMSLMGAKDMSTINTPPAQRHPVKTAVVEYNDQVIKDALAREIKRNGQVYFVHNRVQGIEKIAEKLKHLVPRARIAIAHGQMPEKMLEKTMIGFIKGDIDVLVCTTIIESGIDIPNANTIIINRADTFGLAGLYQLRGRVGRFTRNAYAYLLVPNKRTLSGDVQKKLHSMQKFTELGSGFKVAMRDLEIRGAGNILGTQQHGFIDSIGFDLYLRLLKSAVATIKPC